MRTTNLQISDYNHRWYRVEINAAHITITNTKTSQVVYLRTTNTVDGSDATNWYDEGHQRIMRALYELEAAVFTAVDEEAAR